MSILHYSVSLMFSATSDTAGSPLCLGCTSQHPALCSVGNTHHLPTTGEQISGDLLTQAMALCCVHKTASRRLIQQFGPSCPDKDSIYLISACYQVKIIRAIIQTCLLSWHTPCNLQPMSTHQHAASHCWLLKTLLPQPCNSCSPADVQKPRHTHLPATMNYIGAQLLQLRSFALPLSEGGLVSCPGKE